MPTSLLGVLLFVVLLAPGFAYVTLRSVDRPVKTPTVLQETAGVVLRSIVCDTLAILAFGFVRTILPNRLTPDVGAMVRAGGATYAREHYVAVSLWSLAVLLLGCGFAVLGAGLRSSKNVRKWSTDLAAKRPLKWVVPGLRTGVTTEPAWWILFQGEPNTRTFVGCMLDDGTYISGDLFTHSPNSEETQDREFVLTGAIQLRAPGADTAVDHPVGAVAISAHRVQYLTASYIPLPPPSPGAAR